MNVDLQHLAPHFQFRGPIMAAIPYGSGHINDTYKVTVEQGGQPVNYIVQRVNHKVFTKTAELMRNIQRVTEHIRRKLEAIPGSDPSRETLTLIPTTDNNCFYQDKDGNFWRTYIFIEKARTYDTVSSTEQARQAARAFGTFQGMLMDLPGGPLFETIPDFHHTPQRFKRLQDAIKTDSKNRAVKAAAEISFALKRGDSVATVVDGLAAGTLPWRVTHNDTKINNVMLNDDDGRGICVIDLDTVMPGSILYDFGDQVRTTTATAAEDEQDLSKVQFRLDMFEALIRGYLETAGSFLNDEEIRLLPFSGRLITFEIGIRFLTDYLEGDVYFKTHRPDHNLDRCRTQFEMVRQMEEKAEAMEKLLASCLKNR